MAIDWMDQLAGRFIVFDGPDGSGKSTQLSRFIEAAEHAGLDVLHVREPGGTSIGEQIRDVLLNANNTDMALTTEMLLYMASRAQLIEERIAPALDERKLVVADRFVISTLAYQGTAGGLSREAILTVGKVAIRQYWPDVTIIFDVDEAIAAQRMHGKAQSRSAKTSAPHPSLFADRMEARDVEYHRAVRQGFLDQAQRDPTRCLVIDATGDEEQVYQSLMAALERWQAESG